VTDDINISENDPDVLAAEYVLGLLDAETHRNVVARLEIDAGLRAAVYAWADRLQPLSDSLTPEQVPVHIWEAIQRQITASSVVPISAARRTTWLRPKLILPLMALAASIALVVMLRPFDRPVAPAITGHAVLASAETREQFDVTFSNDYAQVSVRATSAYIPTGKAYELWVVPAGGAPKSLGVLATNGTADHQVSADILPYLKQGALLAISLEPPGGSPTGAPTGPVLMSGKIVRV
jgi:anti-sigma-K factor RskA